MREAKRTNVTVLKHQLKKNFHWLKDKELKDRVQAKYKIKDSL